jgi:VWFA-related protein
MPRPAPLAVVILLAGGLAGAPSSSAQSASGPPAQDPQVDPIQAQRPVFRAGANFVLVDAYPRRDGRVVEGLTPEDFVVFEDGKPQAIEAFEFVSGGGVLAMEDRRDPASAAAANREAGDPRNRVFVLFLDGYHTHFEGTRLAAAPGASFLRAISGPSDLFGVVTPEHPVTQLTFSRRLESAEETLRQFWERAFRRTATESIVEPETEHEAFVYQCFVNRYFDPGASERLVRQLIARVRQEQVLNSLMELVARLSAIREARSQILLFSSGWFLARDDASLRSHAWRQRPSTITGRSGLPTIEREEPGLPRNAAECDGELMRMSMLDHRIVFQRLVDDAVRANISIHPVDPAGLATYDDNGSYRLEPLRTLAAATEGVATTGTNDVVTPVRALAETLSSYYLLGYYSTNQTFDGRYRKIEVRLREPDRAVTARRGYLAPTEELVRRMDAARAEEGAAGAGASAIDEALEALAPLDGPTDLFVHAVMSGDEVIVAAEATERALGRQLADGAAASLVVTAADGGDVGENRTPFEPGRRGGVYRVAVPPDSAGPWSVAFRVEGDLGPLSRTIALSRPAAAPIRSRLVYRATPARVSPLRPAPSHLFRRSERLHIEWVASGPLDARSARLLGRDGSVLAVPVTLTETEVDGVAMLAADLRLAPLAPGDYVVEVTASADGGTLVDLIALRVIQ